MRQSTEISWLYRGSDDEQTEQVENSLWDYQEELDNQREGTETEETNSTVSYMST